MERTNKFVAKLDKFDTKAFPDRYYDIEEMICAYKKLNETDEVVSSHLIALKNIMRKAIPALFSKGIEDVVVRPLVLNVS